MAIVTRKLVLQGAHAGKSVVLSGYKFEDGEMTVTGPEEELDKLCRLLKRSYQAEVEGGSNEVQEDGEVPNGEADLRSGSSADAEEQPEDADVTGSGDTEAGEAGPEDATGDGARSIAEAVKSLDPNDDALWTNGGLPKVEAVAETLGRTDVTRKSLEAALPGWTRDKAHDQL